MIRINLLPAKKRKEKVSRQVSFRFSVIPLLALAVAGGIFAKNARDLARLRAQDGAFISQRASLDGVYKEFLGIERQKREMAERIALIDRIKEGRAVVPKMLFDLSSLAKGNLWLKKLRKDETKVDLEGRSIDNESICTFVEGMSKLPYMKDVELKSVEDLTETGMTVKKFLVEGSVAS